MATAIRSYSYCKILVWVMEQKHITYTMLQTRFNIKYKNSREIIHTLQDECIISSVSNMKGEYVVLNGMTAVRSYDK